MYIYKFGYHSPEDSQYIELYHSKQYTNKQFERIVVNAIVEVLTHKRPDHTKGWVLKEGVPSKQFLKSLRSKWRKILRERGDKHDDESVRKQVMKYHRRNLFLQFPDIVYDLKQILIDEYGFESVEYQAVFDIFGWQGLVDGRDNWGKEKDPLFTKIRRKYKQEMKKSGK